MCNQCSPKWPSWAPPSPLFDGNDYCGVALSHTVFPYDDPVVRTTLYRHYGYGGRLLYVGITKDPLRRFAEHHKSSDWSILLEYTTYEHFDSRNEALDAEWVAIRDENPEYNSSRLPPPYWEANQTESPSPYVNWD